MTEPDVTLTDYGLSLECALFTYVLWRMRVRERALRNWFAAFFVSLAIASFLGGTVHGFFLDTETIGYRILWPASLMAIGVATLAAWIIGARIQFSSALARRVSIAAALAFAAYCIVVLSVTQTFRVAVVNYAPASVFLLVVFLLTYLRARENAFLVGMAGIVLTFIAGAIQQFEIALHPAYFNHNAFYHLVEAMALLMIFLSARSISGTTLRSWRRPC